MNMMDILQLLERCQQIIDGNPELDKLDGAPSMIFSAWPTGMPRGTNDPIAALLQRMDVNEALDRIESYCRKADIQILPGKEKARCEC